MNITFDPQAEIILVRAAVTGPAGLRVLTLALDTNILPWLNCLVAGVARLRDSTGIRLNSCESSYSFHPKTKERRNTRASVTMVNAGLLVALGYDLSMTSEQIEIITHWHRNDSSASY